jgi:hypothetical protein
MHNFFACENFITHYECEKLFEWTFSKYKNQELKYTKHCERHTTRFINEHIIFPSEAYTIQDRIEKKYNILSRYRTIFANGQGIYSGLAEPFKGHYEKHKDPVYRKDTVTLHCNIVVTENLGGEVCINGELIEMKRGMLIVYPVSEVEHEVLPVRDNTFRNLWVFGYSVPKNELFECDELKY